MTRTRITAQGALDLLGRVVDREGASTVRFCRYTEMRDSGLVPLCIVGCVLVDLGVSVEDLSMVSNVGIWSLWRIYQDSLLSSLDFTVGALEVLGEAQNTQDNRRLWGDAVACARRVAERLKERGQE